MKDAAPTVFIVGKDRTVLEGLRPLLAPRRLRVEAYATAQEFEQAHDPHRPGCLILDMRLPGASGMEVYRRLRAIGCKIPVILLTEQADVPQAVQAVREGVFHFLLKPVGAQYLGDQVQKAIALDLRNRRQAAENNAIAARFAGLSTREREVLAAILAGDSNKAMAAHLGIAITTVRFHRANIMKKIGARSVAELVCLLLRSGWQA
ncbi:MAG TPA: response regulator [Sedimentisphaerales bacterium]|nr:response regulator [Sedimentisphaerales bacterium]